MPNSNRITKDWLDIADANLSKKLQPFANAKVVKVLDTAPRTTQEWEALTSYIVDGVTHPFKPGDEVRVPDEDNENGYTYYKLFAITSGVAKWSNSEGNVTSRVKVTVNLDTYVSTDGNTYTKTSGDDVAGTVVTLTENSEGTVVTKTVAAGETSVVFKGLTPFLNYTLSVSAVDGYSQPANQTITNPQIEDELTNTFAYYADEYTFTATSNQDTQSTPDEIIAAVKATVTYGGESFQKIGTMKFPKDTVLTSVTWPDVTGYSKTSSNTGFAYSAEYSTEVLSITSVTSDKAGDDFAGVTFTVNNVTKVYGTDTLTWKIPYGTSDVITADRTGFGVTITKTPNTDIADSVSKTATIAYEEMKNGVFAYYSNGTMKPLSQADSDAIGVAVVYDDATFVIGKNTTQLAFGGYNTVNLTGTAMVTTDRTTALTDFDGYRNTSRIMNALKNQAGNGNGSGSYPPTTGAPAAEWCRTQFSGEGYLPSLGEMNFAYQHKADIDAMMTKIEGTAMGTDYRHWISTHYNATQHSWKLSWSNGSADYGSRYYSSYYVRAFQALKTSITLNLSATDSSSISGQTVLVSDKLGNVQTAVSDSNGQVTFSNVACGQVFVSVKKCLVNSNRTIKVSPTNKVFTIGFRTPNVGLYYYSLDANGNGVLSPSSATNAIGVAVVTSDCAFVIDKNDLSAAKGGAGIAWGGYNVDLSNIGVMVTDNSTTAKTDFSGEENTAKVINALYQVEGAASDSYPATYGAPALETCTTAFNGKGYMPSLGEWNAAYSNYSTINTMMSNISGSADIRTSYYHWASTIYDATQRSWRLLWSDGSTSNDDRFYNDNYVRAFQAL